MNHSLFAAMNGMRKPMEGWLAHLHQHPETAMQEENTARYITEVLKSFGDIEVTGGIGKYGIVATLKNGSSPKSIGLRADFDALPIAEENDLPYKSQVPGKAHLCGHDGHTAMLLGAAKYLAETRNFDGTVRFIFQPAEETMEGGPAMIRDGLFERFPVDAVYGLHNMPGLPVGTFHFADGAFMAAVDNWDIVLTGKGGHGSMPEVAIDPVVGGASLVMALQTIVSRNISPWNKTVVSIGAFNAGSTNNVIPQAATLKLSVRTLNETDRELVHSRIRAITAAQAESFNLHHQIVTGLPGAVLVNAAAETQFACETAKKYFGAERVVYPAQAYMGSEDFAFMLQQKAGCYGMLGNGDGPMVHHPNYRFNPEILPIGAAYWVALATEYLGKTGQE